MSISNKPVTEIKLAEFQDLIENKVTEKKTIDYKLAFSGNSRDDKKEFLADISSFANSSGGWIIYGIREEQGVPVELVGMEDFDYDGFKLRLENLIRDCVKPRISGVQFSEKIEVAPNRYLAAIHIPKSWAAPHVVDFDGHWKFYARNSAGKYPLDVDEVRRAFALSETTGEKIRNFRLDRLAKIGAGETPVPMPEGPKIVLHIVPLISFEPGVNFDVISLKSEICNLPTLDSSNFNYFINFDGLCTYYDTRSSQAISYSQIFRSGIIESVGTDNFFENDGMNCIDIDRIEKMIINNLSRYLRAFKCLDIELPAIFMLSLLGIKGYVIIFGHDIKNLINQNNLLLSEIMLSDIQTEPAIFLKPLFDQIWNAGGWSRSMNYDENGNRKTIF